MRPPRTRCASLAVVWGLVACASSPSAPDGVSAGTWSAWGACEADADCQTKLLTGLLASDAATAVQLAASIPDRERRWVVVSRTVHADPARSGALCATLADAALEERCNSDTSRPHLYTEPGPRRSRAEPRTAAGPDSSTLLLHGVAPSRFAGTPPNAGACASSGDLVSCATGLATDHAKNGRPDMAAAACLTIANASRWQGECMFRAAEALARDQPDGHAGGAVELCLLARAWVGRCVEKIHEVAARRAPVAGVGAEGWAPISTRWEAMDAVWARQSAAVRSVVESHFWSGVLARSYHSAHVPTGDPLDHLPAAAVPHVRAAAAYALLHELEPHDVTLAGVSQALVSVLERREGGTGHPVIDPDADLPRTDFWAEDAGNDGSLPATYYLGISRRIVSEDAAEDRQICVLEAAARRGTTWSGMVEEGLASEAPLVAATAQRLRAATARGR